jgi:hypothetical protein
MQILCGEAERSESCGARRRNAARCQTGMEWPKCPGMIGGCLNLTARFHQIPEVKTADSVYL